MVLKDRTHSKIDTFDFMVRMISSTDWPHVCSTDTEMYIFNTFVLSAFPINTDRSDDNPFFETLYVNLIFYMASIVSFISSQCYGLNRNIRQNHRKCTGQHLKLSILSTESRWQIKKGKKTQDTIFEIIPILHLFNRKFHF